MTTQYIAYTVKGLEQIATDEITHMFSDAVIQPSGEKRVIFTTQSPLKALTKLKTVDDIQILLQTLTTPTLTTINEALHSIDFSHIRNILADFRSIPSPTFSLTYGAVNTDLTSEAVLEIVKTAIHTTYGWHYEAKNHTNFDIRVFIDHDSCYISVRITPQSLHHRKYKQFEKPGSLRPSVAAALVQLATKGAIKGKFVDNFCGSGTILCEARLKDIDVYGGDKDNESALYTLKNLANIKKVSETNIHVSDAVATSWPTNYFDYAVSNLPYGKQIPLPQITKLYEQTLKEYNRITKNTAVICFLLTNPDLMEKYIKQTMPQATIQKYQLGFTGQTPTIMLIQK